MRIGIRFLTVLGMVSSLVVAVPSANAAEAIKIGAIYIMSGPFAIYGKFARDGMELAVDEINASGGVMGRKLELVIEDSTGKARVAIQAARKLIFQDKVHGLIGLDRSSVARAVVPRIPELKRTLLITHAATPDVTGKLCNKYVFRDSVNINQNIKAAAVLAKSIGAKRWMTIGPNYAFGHQSWEFFQKYLKELQPDVEFLGSAFPKFGSEDFTPFINKVIAAKPDGVIVSLWGGDLVNFVRQANNLGFFKKDFKVLLTLGGAVEVLTALGDQMPEGLWVGTRYWFRAKETANNKKFVEAYKKRFGTYPSYNSQNAYAGIYVYKAAIEKAGSTDPDKIAAAMSGLTVTAPIGKFTLRAEDHQATVDGFWGVTKADPNYPIRILDPIRVFPSAQITPSPADTGCNL